MSILFIVGLGLLVGITAWFKSSEILNDWADDQERRHFEQQQEERKWASELFFT